MADESKTNLVDLEKELGCSICTEVLYQPLTLIDCLHSFCGSCLKEWFSAQSKRATSSHPYTCPSCRAQVLGTKPNAFITSLLEEYLRANPGRQKTDEEKAAIAKTYRPGEQILLQVSSRTRPNNHHRRLAEELQDLRLAADRARGGDDGRSAHTQRERSRDRRDDARGHRTRQSRGRETSDEPASWLDIQAATSVRSRAVEHQSSLRSLLSASDFDIEAPDIEEEIARQIIEEGLLEGIDLSHIGVEEENLIRDRIDDAYRRRRRTGAGSSRRGSRTHSRSQSVSAQGAHSRIPQPAETTDASSTRPERRRRRSITSPRSSSPGPSGGSASRDQAGDVRRAAARSATDLSQTRRPGQPGAARPPTTSQRGETIRSTTDPEQGSAGSSGQRRRRSDHVRVTPSRGEGVSLPGSRQASNGTSQHNDAVAAAVAWRRADQTSSRTEASRMPRTRTDPAVDSSARPVSSGQGAAAGTTSGPLPSSSSTTTAGVLSNTSRTNRALLYPEPLVNCKRCARGDIQYELHYNCSQCDDGEYNICLSCYRQGRGCEHWYGFGSAAWSKYERQSPPGGYPPNHPLPHTLTGRQYLRLARQDSVVQGFIAGPSSAAGPAASPSSGDAARRPLTTEDPQKRLLTGVFCSICSVFANACLWKCDVCNDGEWGFCHRCVSTGQCCTHPLLPLLYVSSSKDAVSSQQQQQQQQEEAPPSHSSTPSDPPGKVTFFRGPQAIEHGPLKPISIVTSCNVCRFPINALSPRYHCLQCSHGDYDICSPCYVKLCSSGRIGAESGSKGWRRCLRGHRMIVVVFEDQEGGRKRVVTRDLVGGLALKDDLDGLPVSATDAADGARAANATAALEDTIWDWRDGPDGQYRSKRVSKGHYPVGYRSSTTTGNPSPSLSSQKQQHHHHHHRPNNQPVPQTGQAPQDGQKSSLSAPQSSFPPDGGVGMIVLARWGYFPNADVTDELMFPRGAEIREVEDINGDWYWGCYAGRKGLFPGPYVHLVGVVGAVGGGDGGDGERGGR
ncbi:MAG: hypothetical protein M1815_005946 [Lichina confinis]|nr:MAG: hypothetical protein M1815_005946 [Lichina confinis]